MSRWFRHYAGLCRDEKLVSVAIKSKQPIERTFFRYIRHDEINTIWASGFNLTELSRPHGFYAVLGEFRCCK